MSRKKHKTPQPAGPMWGVRVKGIHKDPAQINPKDLAHAVVVILDE